jgi:hypothetical protein
MGKLVARALAREFMREQTYGEIAWRTLCKLCNYEGIPDWDDQPESVQSAWENVAACVLVEYHKRQVALSRQTQPLEFVDHPQVGDIIPGNPPMTIEHKERL